MNKSKYITKGVESNVVPLLQLFMWQCVEEMPKPRDYLQVFRCTLEDGEQKITHIQEEPNYQKEYLLRLTDTPFFVGKIFVIEEDDHIKICFFFFRNFILFLCFLRCGIADKFFCIQKVWYRYI